MSQRLASWFDVWHPRYRTSLVLLILLGVLGAGFAYVQNVLLGLFLPSLASIGTMLPAGGASTSSTTSEDATPIPAIVRSMALRAGTAPFAVILAMFIASTVAAAAADFWHAFVTGRLKRQSEDDVEAEILNQLLRKDEAFFARHSPAETVSRLAMDLSRVTERRLMSAWSPAVLLLANLFYFFQQDRRLAVLAVGGCLAGAIWTIRLTGRVKQMDADYLRQHDRASACFEDFLRAAPEVQVGELFGKLRGEYHQLQRERSETFLRYIRLNASLSVGNAAAYLAAFLTMILVVAYRARTQEYSRALDLVPVVVFALPKLFGNTSQLVFVRVRLQLAQTSMKRLLEYEALTATYVESAAEPQSREVAAAVGADSGVGLRGDNSDEFMVAQGLTYRYTSVDGTVQGGVFDVAARFAPGTWTAVVGGAGSGKSTLVKLLLGRLRPQQGRVLYGRDPLHTLPSDRSAALLSLMPQSLALMDATILQNLLFGLPSTRVDLGARAISERDLEVITRIGLGRVCQGKALDMVCQGWADGALASMVAELRRDARAQLQEVCGITVLPYEDGHIDPSHWIIEILLSGRCDRPVVIEVLLQKRAERVLGTLCHTSLGIELAAAGQSVLRQGRRLLSLPNFSDYAQLAPATLDERIWKLRVSHAYLADAASFSEQEGLRLCMIALTSSPTELPDRQDWTSRRTGSDAAGDIKRLRELVGDACRSFEPAQVHPNLTWRENLVFGGMDVPNSRAGRLVDQVLLDCVERRGQGIELARLGLNYRIGRLGGRLSGGQGQLVGLCRALLRRTPVLVLDEPTSALDPASRALVTEFLRDWRKDRILITVSHDPEFVRQADRVLLLEAGRLAAVGTFDELTRTSEAFRTTLRQT